MLNDFRTWLLIQNYTPNTATDYAGRIERLCQKENISLETLIKKFSKIMPDYEKNGSKHAYGRRSHCSVLNALRQFKKFIDIQM